MGAGRVSRPLRPFLRLIQRAALAEQMPRRPQEQRAVKVRHKEQLEGDPALRLAIADAESRLGSGGRVLVRPSGTEPALRVMVEGSDRELVRELADALSNLAEQRLHWPAYVRHRGLHCAASSTGATTPPASPSSTSRASSSWRSAQAS